MIYFVVAQKESDGNWEVFGPWEYVDGADSRIAQLEDDPRYAQVELARVLTDEDNPDRDEWLDDDEHETPQEENEVRSVFKIKGGTVAYNSGQEAKDALYSKMLMWFLKQELFSGEDIGQSDTAQLEGPDLLCEIADQIFKFRPKRD